MPIPIYHKSPESKFAITLEYQTPDLKAGETISQATCAVYPTGLTIVTPCNIDGAEVSTVVSGGTAGVDYLVLFDVRTSAGMIYNDKWKDAAIVKVR